MTFSKHVAALGAAFCLLFTLPAQAALSETFTLKNGLEVVLIPNHRVPAVTHMIWYKVGAADDYPGRSGLAHYNEHMMFQGTEAQAGGEFARIVAAHGGRTNAFTGRDYTGYYVTIGKESLPLVMQMEADRMLHLAPTQANFLKERQVIIEERRMSIENQPGALMSEELHAMLYRNHPYHNPIIGWMHEMEALTREDVLAFHREFYHPANAIIVVSGDITREELEPLAERYYGSLPPGDPYVRHWRSEPPARGARHLDMHHANVTQPELVRFYAAPSLHGDQAALVVPGYVLAQMLGGGQTSKLYQALVVEQKLAVSIDADYDGTSVGPGEFRIDATPAPGVSLPTLETALNAQLVLATRPDAFTPDALIQAKTLLKADTIYERDGLENLARTLGTLLMAGLTPDFYEAWPAKIDAVTANNVQAAAKAVFDPAQSVTGYLLPEGSAPSDPAPANTQATKPASAAQEVH